MVRRLTDAPRRGRHGGRRGRCRARVSLFGTPLLPPAYLRVLVALARARARDGLRGRRPAATRWRRDADGRAAVRRARAAPAAARARRPHARHGRPVRPARRARGVHTRPRSGAASRRAALGAAHAPARPPDRHAARRARRRSTPADRSLRVLDAHSPLREVEALRDEIYDAFDTIPGLRPSDVAILVPDLPTYAPLVEAVFATAAPAVAGRARPAMPLPVHVADPPRGAERHIARRASTACSACSTAARPPRTCWACSTCRPSAARPARRGRGRDGPRLGAPDARPLGPRRRAPRHATAPDDEPARCGRRRPPHVALRAGPPAARRPHGPDRRRRARPPARRRGPRWTRPTCSAASPSGSTPSSPPSTRSARAAPARRLGRRPAALHRPHARARGHRRDDGRRRPARRRRPPRDAAPGHGATRPTSPRSPLGEVQAHLGHALASLDRDEPYLTGRITVVDPTAARHVPFRVVAVVGLGDAFPRSESRPAFDLLAVRAEPGDPDPAGTDRQTFLDAVLATRDRLILSYTGRSQRDGTERAASAVLDALLDTCAATFDAPERLVVRHRLQPFSPAYFGDGDSGSGDSGEPPLYTYAAQNRPASARPRPAAPRSSTRRRPRPPSATGRPARRDDAGRARGCVGAPGPRLLPAPAASARTSPTPTCATTPRPSWTRSTSTPSKTACWRCSRPAHAGRGLRRAPRHGRAAARRARPRLVRPCPRPRRRRRRARRPWRVGVAAARGAGATVEAAAWRVAGTLLVAAGRRAARARGPRPPPRPRPRLGGPPRRAGRRLRSRHARGRADRRRGAGPRGRLRARSRPKRRGRPAGARARRAGLRRTRPSRSSSSPRSPTPRRCGR